MNLGECEQAEICFLQTDPAGIKNYYRQNRLTTFCILECKFEYAGDLRTAAFADRTAEIAAFDRRDDRLGIADRAARNDDTVVALCNDALRRKMR